MCFPLELLWLSLKYYHFPRKVSCSHLNASETKNFLINFLYISRLLSRSSNERQNYCIECLILRVICKHTEIHISSISLPSRVTHALRACIVNLCHFVATVWYEVCNIASKPASFSTSIVITLPTHVSASLISPYLFSIHVMILVDAKSKFNASKVERNCLSSLAKFYSSQ